MTTALIYMRKKKLKDFGKCSKPIIKMAYCLLKSLLRNGWFINS